MRVELRDVSKGRGQALPPVSLAYDTGAPVLAMAETEQRPAVLGLIASGRMRPDTGAVTADGMTDAAGIRRRVALVDAPEVCDPAPNVTVAGIVAEELMFAGRPSTPRAVRRWLDAHDARSTARTPIADVRPSQRVRLLLELAALRAGVESMVLVSPDRHGGDPEHWWDVVEEFGARGYGVLAIAGAAAASVLADRAPRAELPTEPAVPAGPEESTEPEEHADSTDVPDAAPEESAIEPESTIEPESADDSPAHTTAPTDPEPEPAPETEDER